MFILFVLGAGIAGLWSAVALRAMHRRTHPGENISGTTTHEATLMTAATMLFIVTSAIQLTMTGV